jgi:hypothetical protein
MRIPSETQKILEQSKNNEAEAVLHELAANTKIADMTVAHLVQLISQAVRAERDRADKRIDHLWRMVNLLRSNERARAAKELHAAAMLEHDDGD